MKNEQEGSVVKNPVPFTEIASPAFPDVGLSVIDGARTVNGAETVSPAPLVACAWTLYIPAATLSTTNEPLKFPPDMLQPIGVEAMGVPDSAQVESVEDQPEPETVTTVPA